MENGVSGLPGQNVQEPVVQVCPTHRDTVITHSKLT